jgi:MoxR-like ATPase
MKKHYQGDLTANLSEPYIPDADLKNAVNLAIDLERPLLLKGEPGCGKTKLARAVAEELGMAYFEWPVKSTSRAQDGLYTYDTIGRLRDAQLSVSPHLSQKEQNALNKKFSSQAGYVNWGPLGKALQPQKFYKNKNGAVLLIDEIDKADIDFPNDLLHVIEERAFTVPEVNPPVEIPKDNSLPLIIFITSNDEKELPAPFLRRCLFFYIEFPLEETLREIVSHHIRHTLTQQNLEEGFAKFVEEAVNRFWLLRERMDEDKQYGGKKVSTSELIDWVKILKSRYFDAKRPLPPATQELLFPSVLLKSLADYLKYANKEK